MMCVKKSQTKNIAYLDFQFHRNDKAPENNAAYGSNGGQAAIEYVLILSVLVVIGGGLLFQFNKNISAWGKALLGTDGYFACLLQTGLLPTQNRPGMECSSAQQMARAALEENIDSNINNSSGSSYSNNNANNKSSSNNSNSSSSSNNSDNSDSTATNAPSDSGGGNPLKKGSKRSSTHSPSGRIIPFNSSNGLFDSESLTAKKRYRVSKRSFLRKGLGFKKNKADAFAGYGTDTSGRRYSQIFSGGHLTEKQEQEIRSQPISLPMLVQKKQNMSHKNKKPMLISKNLRAKKQKGPEVGDWSFGYVFRLVLIIGILCIIAFLIFSQLQSVRKSLK